MNSDLDRLMYEGPSVVDEKILSVYVILNGTLGMSPGKCASQAFHCGFRVRQDHERLGEWVNQGRRVVVRLAETPHVFERAIEECDGWAQYDEGLTEVERGSMTAFVTVPYLRSEAPKILTHKRLQLYGQH